MLSILCHCLSITGWYRTGSSGFVLLPDALGTRPCANQAEGYVLIGHKITSWLVIRLCRNQPLYHAYVWNLQKQPDEEDIENVELGSHTDGQENSERLRRRVKRENVITPEYVTENGRQIRVVKLVQNIRITHDYHIMTVKLQTSEKQL